MKHEEIVILLQNVRSKKTTTELEAKAIGEAITILSISKSKENDKASTKTEK